MLVEDREIDLFVGTKIGSFKHIKYHTDSTLNSKKHICNLVEVKSLEKGDGFTCMRWGNEGQTEVVVGRDNQQIQTYSTTSAAFTQTENSPAPLAGVGRCTAGLISATTEGVVSIWGDKREDTNVGSHIRCFNVCEGDRSVYSVGGKDFDLKLYNITSPEPVFTSKSVRHDWLELRRDVDCVDLIHMDGGKEVAVVSPLRYIRLYDTRAQRRPVCEVTTTDKLAPTTISQGLHNREVAVGFNRGHLHCVDLRNKRLDKGYKGAVGAITGVSVISSGRPSVVSVSLDRHVRVHDYVTKECLYKQYLTSKLTSLLVQSASHTPLNSKLKGESIQDDTCEPVQGELDQVFQGMETVCDVRGSKRSLQPSTDGATDDTTHEDPDSAIVRLLRSTERKKRRTEREKRERKRKSVFHNA